MMKTTKREPDHDCQKLRSLMSSRKKPVKPKRLFSKRNQSRRAPPSLHYEEKAPEPRYYAEYEYDKFEDGAPQVLVLRNDPLPPEFANIAPQAPPGTAPVDVNDYGMLKMSVVLKMFVQPFQDDSLDERSLEEFFLLASVAWNLALEPGGDVAARIRGLLKPAIGRVTDEEFDAALKVVEAMVQRKHDHFEDDRRVIGDLKVFPIKDGDYYLQVVSGLHAPDARPRRSWISKLTGFFGRR